MFSHEDKSFEQRLADSNKIINKYPDRVCVYIEKDPLCKKLPNLDRNKYVVPRTIAMSHFIYIIRQRIKLPKDVGIFLYSENVLLSGNLLMNEVNYKYKNPDGFIYIKYKGENCFG